MLRWRGCFLSPIPRTDPSSRYGVQDAYTSPTARSAVLEAFFADLKYFSRGSAAVIREFNARLVCWARVSNGNREGLLRSKRAHELNVAAPKSSMFRVERGTSVIDVVPSMNDT